MSNIEIILTILTALGVRELLPVVFSSVFKRKEDVQAKDLENIEKIESGNREQIVFLKQQLAEAYQEIDTAQDVLNKKRQQINELARRVFQLELEIEKFKKDRDNFCCYVQNCTLRENNKK